jgi:DNA mismatch repair protein MutL
MEVDYEEDESRVSGFASRPLGGRADRSLQLFYVNRRPVKDRILQAAINQAFLGLLEKNKSAEAFLCLSLPFSELDVNVHPAKAEVRFKDSQFIFRLVLRAIEKAAIRENRIKEIAPSLGLSYEAKEGAGAKGLGFGRPGSRVEETPLPVYFKRGEGVGDGDAAPGKAADTGMPGAPDEGKLPVIPEAAKPGPVVLGQYLDMYIVAMSEDGILVVDQHNAHERVLYEKYLEISAGARWPGKMLLVPAVFDLSPLQRLTLEGAQSLFEESGFVVEAIGGRSYALKEFPDIFSEAEAKDVFLALLEEVGAERALDTKEKLLAAMACKSAVKAGQPLAREKMEYLLAELFKTSQPSLCPHGRPIVVKISKSEIEKGLRRS